jgi:hypothetical protein
VYGTGLHGVQDNENQPPNLKMRSTDTFYTQIVKLCTSLIDTQKAKHEKPDTVRLSAVSGTRQRTFYWRGFVSPVGTSSPTNHNKSYLQSHSSHGGRNQAIPPQNAGGKWPKEAKGKSFRYPAPYRGGPKGAKR